MRNSPSQHVDKFVLKGPIVVPDGNFQTKGILQIRKLIIENMEKFFSFTFQASKPNEKGLLRCDFGKIMSSLSLNLSVSRVPFVHALSSLGL